MTYRLSRGRPQIGGDARERLADSVAPAQVAPSSSPTAGEFLPPPLVGLPLAELEQRGRVREALHDRVHEARVAQVLQPLGVVGHRARRGATADARGMAECWAKGCEVFL